MTGRVAKHRYSRRQITKRPFKITSPGGSTSKKVHRDVTHKPTKTDVNKTPPSLQDSIGDVSVSFLASTPKPGKKQLSRRRPLSAVHESKVSKTGFHGDNSRSHENTRSPENSRSNNKSRSIQEGKSKLHTKDSSRSQKKDKSVLQQGHLSKENIDNYEFYPQAEDSAFTSDKQLSRNNIQRSRLENVSSSKKSSSSLQSTLHNTNDKSQAKKKAPTASADNVSSRLQSQSASKIKRNENKPTSKSSNKKGSVNSETNYSANKNSNRPTTQIRSKDDKNSQQNVAHNNRLETSSSHNKSVKRKKESSKLAELRSNRTVTSDSEESLNKRRKVSIGAESIVVNKSTASKKKASTNDRTRKVSIAAESILVNKSTTSKKAASNERTNKRTHSNFKTQSKNRTLTEMMKKNKKLSLDNEDMTDISVLDREDSAKKRKQPIGQKNSRPQKTRKLSADEDRLEKVPAQIVTIHESDVERKKSDVMDLDVVLSAFVETLDTEMEELDTQAEKSAAKLIQKYMVEDVSTMVNNVHNVKKLQERTKKGRQTLKERQNNLMYLQKKKSELMVGKGKRSLEEERQSADNMKEINTFLTNMKNLIAGL